MFPFIAGPGVWQIEHGLALKAVLYVALAAILVVFFADTLNYHRLRAAGAGTPPCSDSTSSQRGRRSEPILLAILGLAVVLSLAIKHRRERLLRWRGHGARKAPAHAAPGSKPSTSATEANLPRRLSSIIIVVLLFVIAASLWLRLVIGWTAPWRHAVLRSITDTPTGAWRHAMLRSMHLTSGVSPILPMLLLLVAGLWWLLQMSAGYLLLDARRPRLPMGVHRKRIGFIAERVEKDSNRCQNGIGEFAHAAPEDTYMVTELLRALRPENVFSVSYRLSFVTWLAVPLGLGVFEPIMTLEHPRFGQVLWYLFLLPALALISGTTLRLWDIWLKARRLLTMLDSLPLRRGFQELKEFSWQPLWRPGLATTDFQRIGARVGEARACAQNTAPQAFHGIKNPVDERCRKELLRDLERICVLHYKFSVDWWERRRLEMTLFESYSGIQEGHALAGGRALDYLAKQWEEEKEEPRRHRKPEDQDASSVRACESFVCLLYVNFLKAVLERIRTLMMAIGGMYILILLAMTSYPFQPRATIVSVLAVLLFYIVAVVTSVFAQVHRNATFSHITNTKPGELGVDFWLKTGSFVALPLFTFFVSQFPQINRFLYAWVEPAVRALGK